jgi:hypothetical protein
MDRVNLIVFHPPCIDYNVSKEVLSQYDCFKNAKPIFEKNHINLIYFYELLPPEDSTKYYDMKENFNYSDNDRALINIYYKDVKYVRNLILENMFYENSILYSFEIISSWSVRPDNGLEKMDIELYNKYNKMNIRQIFSCYDFHAFYINYYKQRHNLYNENKESISIFELLKLPIETHANNINNMWFDYNILLISPTVQYIENIKSKYAEKTEFIPFSYNPNNAKIFELQDFDNYFNRERKILMSGSCPAYTHRKLITFIKQNKEELYLLDNVINLNQREAFSNIIEIMPYEIYNRKNTKYNEERGIRYLKTISKYMAAFMCFGDFPIDFHLAKLWEIMLSGTLIFIEPKDMLQTDLGLIPYVHYVPMLIDENNKLIIDMEHYNKYLNTNDGFKIAKQGFEYIRDNFTDEKVAENFCAILKRRNLI